MKQWTYDLQEHTFSGKQTNFSQATMFAASALEEITK